MRLDCRLNGNHAARCPRGIVATLLRKLCLEHSLDSDGGLFRTNSSPARATARPPSPARAYAGPPKVLLIRLSTVQERSTG